MCQAYTTVTAGLHYVKYELYMPNVHYHIGFCTPFSFILSGRFYDIVYVAPHMTPIVPSVTVLPDVHVVNTALCIRCCKKRVDEIIR